MKKYDISRKFYNELQDEESRYIYRQRIEYLFTGDRDYIVKMVKGANQYFHSSKKTEGIISLFDLYRENKKVVLYGAGECSGLFFESMKKAEFDVLAFCETNKSKFAKNGYMHLGTPVIDGRQLLEDAKYKNIPILISTIGFADEILNILISHSVNTERIFTHNTRNFTNYRHSENYFGLDFLPPVKNEIYVDAGVFNGDTIINFVNWCGGNYAKIFGFEPSPDTCKMASENLTRRGIEHVTLVQKGAYSRDGEFLFVTEYGSGMEGAKIVDGEISSKDKQITIQTTSIDKIVKDEHVTLIKMDIEGAELEALKGATNTILKNRPRLAICIYHRPEDIVEIPQFLYQLDLGYKFFIRHHNYIHNLGDIAIDTVLYAV
jgi:FkbM family methyltransferase